MTQWTAFNSLTYDDNSYFNEFIWEMNARQSSQIIFFTDQYALFMIHVSCPISKVHFKVDILWLKCIILANRINNNYCGMAWHQVSGSLSCLMNYYYLSGLTICFPFFFHSLWFVKRLRHRMPKTVAKHWIKAKHFRLQIICELNFMKISSECLHRLRCLLVQ